MSAVPFWFSAGVFIAFGLLFGSFANVVIWRVPRGESIVSPGSHCPACGHAVRWYDNIPIVSWLVLRGRCRDCGEPIVVRYVLVEAASGLLFALAIWAFGVTIAAVVAAALFWLLLVLSAIDLDHMRLPNPLVAALALVGLIGVVASELFDITAAPLVGVATSGLFSSPLAAAVAGVALGAGVSGGVAALYGVLRHKHGLGMGDVKLLGALGIFLGPYVVVALFLGSLFGAIAGIVALRRGGGAGTRIPFGPWLAAGGAVTAIVGPELVGWYLRVAGLA